MDLPVVFFSSDENILKVTDMLKNKFEMKQANRKMCLKLNHALYGLVQAARSWWLKFVNALVNVSFERGEVDPCLIYRKNEYGILILILYVDDCLLTGDTLAIESGINNIKKMFNVTVTKKVEEYLGCRIDTVGDKTCPGAECTKIKSSTTNTEDVQTDENNTLDRKSVV